MQKIFYENSYKKEFVAEIIDIKEIENKCNIVKDKKEGMTIEKV